MTPLWKSPNPNFFGTIRTRFNSPDVGRVNNGQSVGHASPLLLNSLYAGEHEPPPLVSGLMYSIRAGTKDCIHDSSRCWANVCQILDVREVR